MAKTTSSINYLTARRPLVGDPVASIVYDAQNRPTTIVYKLGQAGNTEEVTLSYTDEGYLIFKGNEYRNYQLNLWEATLLPIPVGPITSEPAGEVGGTISGGDPDTPYIFVKEDNLSRLLITNASDGSNGVAPILDGSLIFTGWYLIKLNDKWSDLYKKFIIFNKAEATSHLTKVQNYTNLRSESYDPYLKDNITIYNDVPTATTDTQSIDVSGYTNVTVTYELVSPTTTSVRVKGIVTDTEVEINQAEAILSNALPKAILDLGAFSGQVIKFNLSDITSSGDTVQIKVRGRW